ncbi:hypothetical protein GGR21_000073 [Dysgonomonas hofstadii]|uniref:DUF5017 domain-containing protein n=1 Tax=Dysgonomonas hofstadii TaxID=637886 RepID=A0A840CJK6_9BACT|nr:DUF5017 domain-containing protein [Dysgonomonas hofstadii]MBB4034188.1 hypothetical protein [Dysgonomonas hofstadii]
MTNKIFIALISGLLTLVSCENELNESVSLDVSVTADDLTVNGDTIIVKTLTPITFHFSGNPDFISFYSGEVGLEYKNINRTELSIDDIESYLNFDSFAQYGTIPGAIKVYLSTSFGDLSKDKDADIAKINAHEWIDISDLCDLPTASSTNTKASSVSLADYLGEPLVLAFRYKPLNNTAAQPTWEIQNLVIKNVLKKDGSVTTLPAASMGLTAFDIHADPTIAYLPYTVGVHSSNSGVWDFRNISAALPRVRMQSSSAGAELNEDWIISSPLVLNSCLPDKGVAIKSTTAALGSYTYQYQTSGEYEVTFVATNGNMDHYSRIVKNLIIKVID